MGKTTNLADLDTYVFIDVSNIRSAALRSCQIKLDFIKLIAYFQEKYMNLKSVRYYEGIAKYDKERLEQFKEYEKSGYEICSLARKTYIDPAVYRTFICKNIKCKTPNRIRVLAPSTKMKSNVDVYIATELLEIAHSAKKPTHIILLACDGDYAEMIRSAVKNKNVHVTVIATPPTKINNALSARLKQLRNTIPNYQLTNIMSFKDKIS
ncbi:MAG: NYN domain-containing protein [Lachnospiraceae bacterium]|nr:NYN domain-containing protein [Lachnospiraceae bacterium]